MFILAITIAFASSCETYELSEPGLLVPLTVTEDASLPSIGINGTILHSETFGNPEDPMVVTIHGGPGSDYRSILNCKNLADEGYYVVFYDQRGSGLSERHDADVFTMQSFIDDLEAVINYYKTSPDQKVILMGHSWGAMIATAFVNQTPEKIDGLILMEPGGFTWEQTLDYIERSQPLELFSETTNDYVYLDQFITSDEQNTLDYKANLKMSASFAEGNVIGNTGPVPFWRNGAICGSATQKYAEDNSFDFRTNLNEYTTKVLFVFGELNEAYGLEYAQLVSSSYPNVQLVEIKDAGHEIPHFAWNNLYPVAQSYLKEITQ